jgi:hypothetical protein
VLHKNHSFPRTRCSEAISGGSYARDRAIVS